MQEVKGECPTGDCPLRRPPPPPPYTPSDVCCSKEYCRGLAIGALVLMILILILTIIWFALDFTNNISQSDDAWFAMGTFILAFIGIIIMLVMEFRCTRCFVCLN